MHLASIIIIGLTQSLLHDVFPSSFWYFPASQFLQELWPIWSLYLPLVQKSQTVAVPLSWVPVGQLVASSVQLEEPATLNLPLEHDSHESSEVCAVWSLKVPYGHDLQED